MMTVDQDAAGSHRSVHTPIQPVHHHRTPPSSLHADSTSCTETSDYFSNKTLSIYDPIHGYIRFNALGKSIIDTPQFQRLHHLKQLGTNYLVFPDCTHSRFEHSLGVAHLAEHMASFLRQDSRLDYLTDSHIQCVKLAGLCHDLGHGPFSHAFDGLFIPRARPGVQWTHEKGSEMLFDYLVDENGIDLELQEIRMIKDLIRGDSSGYPQGQRFLFDIVANHRNSIDVDKFDYIKRDCARTGIPPAVVPDRLIYLSRVIGDEICYSKKAYLDIKALFDTRFSLFSRIYTHKVSKALEHMYVDAMILADEKLQISSTIDDRALYCQLNDLIVHTIKCSRDPELEPSRKILDRIERRQLYKCVGEFKIAREVNWGNLAVDPHIIASYHENPNSISPSDIIVDKFLISYGMGDQNPLDHVKFFGKTFRQSNNDAFHIPSETVSAVVPAEFRDQVVRVFTRDPGKLPGIQRAFHRWYTAVVVPQLGAAQRSQLRYLDSQISELTDAEYNDLHTFRWSPNRCPEHLNRFESRSPFGSASKLRSAAVFDTERKPAAARSSLLTTEGSHQDLAMATEFEELH